MSKNEKNVILEHRFEDKKVDKVMQAEAIYAVHYKGEPINVKTIYPASCPKYKKVNYSAPGHAVMMAERLNKLFNTDEFEVYKLAKAELYKRDE